VFSLRRRGDGGEEEAVALDATAIEQLAAAILGELEPQLRQVLDGFAQRIDRVERRVDELSQAVHDQRRAGAEIAAQVSSALLKDLIATVAGSRAGGEVNLEPVVSRLDGVADGLRVLAEKLPQLVAEQVARAVAEQLAKPVEGLEGAAKALGQATESLERLAKQVDALDKRLRALEASLKTLAEGQGRILEQAQRGGSEQLVKMMEQVLAEARRAAEAATRAASQVEAVSRRVESMIEDLAGGGER
jgi:ABC-type transporter Mla subunit MlaD